MILTKFMAIGVPQTLLALEKKVSRRRVARLMRRLQRQLKDDNIAATR